MKNGAKRMMQKCICIEKREHNSQCPHYNKCGDWRPRYIIWLEYDGYTKEAYFSKTQKAIPLDVQDEWGSIISLAIRTFMNTHQLSCTAVRPLPRGGYHAFDFPKTSEREEDVPPSSLFTRWLAFTPFWRPKRAEYRPTLKAEHFNMCQEYYDNLTFLLHKTLPAWFSTSIQHAPVLDRATLLPFGIVIFQPGIEEAVLELAFSTHEESFLTHLHAAASKVGYTTNVTQRHFLSDWIIASIDSDIETLCAKKKYGERWNEF